jgi:hypothetical protein
LILPSGVISILVVILILIAMAEVRLAEATIGLFFGNSFGAVKAQHLIELRVEHFDIHQRAVAT